VFPPEKYALPTTELCQNCAKTPSILRIGVSF
jgi:hypothetical protein